VLISLVGLFRHAGALTCANLCCAGISGFLGTYFPAIESSVPFGSLLSSMPFTFFCSFCDALILFVLLPALRPWQYSARLCNIPNGPGAVSSAAWWWLLITGIICRFFSNMRQYYQLTYGSLAGVIIRYLIFYLVGLWHVGIRLQRIKTPALAERPPRNGI